MNKKTIHKVNGGIAIYYGIGSIIGAFGGLIAIGIWLFNVFTDRTNFSWGSFAGLILITAALGAIGYSILRIGYEEIEK